MRELSYRENFLVDTTLSMAAGSVGAPLRTVNLRMQLYKDVYESPLHCAKKLGYSSLWKGNLWRCARFLPSRIIEITTEERLQSLLRNIPGVWQSILTNILGSTLSLALVYPIDVHLMKLIHEMEEVQEVKHGSGVHDDRGSILQYWDYTGFPASVGRMVVYFSSYYLLYSAMEYSLPSRIGNMDGFLLNFFLQLGADFASYPLDAISRVQVVEKKSFFEAFTNLNNLYIEEGFYHNYKWNFCISFFGMLISMSASELKRMYINTRCK